MEEPNVKRSPSSPSSPSTPSSKTKPDSYFQSNQEQLGNEINNEIGENDEMNYEFEERKEMNNTNKQFVVSSPTNNDNQSKEQQHHGKEITDALDDDLQTTKNEINNGSRKTYSLSYHGSYSPSSGMASVSLATQSPNRMHSMYPSRPVSSASGTSWTIVDPEYDPDQLSHVSYEDGASYHSMSPRNHYGVFPQRVSSGGNNRLLHHNDFRVSMSKGIDEEDDEDQYMEDESYNMKDFGHFFGNEENTFPTSSSSSSSSSSSHKSKNLFSTFSPSHDMGSNPTSTTSSQHSQLRGFSESMSTSTTPEPVITGTTLRIRNSSTGSFAHDDLESLTNLHHQEDLTEREINMLEEIMTSTADNLYIEEMAIEDDLDDNCTYSSDHESEINIENKAFGSHNDSYFLERKADDGLYHESEILDEIAKNQKKIHRKRGLSADQLTMISNGKRNTMRQRSKSLKNDKFGAQQPKLTKNTYTVKESMTLALDCGDNLAMAEAELYSHYLSSSNASASRSSSSPRLKHSNTSKIDMKEGTTSEAFIKRNHNGNENESMAKTKAFPNNGSYETTPKSTEVSYSNSSSNESDKGEFCDGPISSIFFALGFTSSPGKSFALMRSMAPIVFTHVLTLLIGWYFGRKTALAAANACSQVPQQSVSYTFPSPYQPTSISPSSTSASIASSAAAAAANASSSSSSSSSSLISYPSLSIHGTTPNYSGSPNGLSASGGNGQNMTNSCVSMSSADGTISRA